MRLKTQVQWAILGGLLVTGAARAEFAGVQFSADMVSRSPDGQISTGKMYVGANRMRVELSHQGQRMIRIHDQNRQVEWMLLPDRLVYMEHPVPMVGTAPGTMPAPSAETNPCQGITGLSCRRVGEEDVAGRRAVKWEMTMTHEGQTLIGAQWLDVERGLPLKYQMPNGQAMELRLLGKDSIAGRAVEKWEMTTTVPNQQPVQSLQWYDPELKLAVREEFPGGFVRELTNIQVGPQPDELFTIPPGYSKMEPLPAPR
ncbi:MAG: hypothetical protein ACUVQI_00315 [Thermochromatium sp.]